MFHTTNQIIMSNIEHPPKTHGLVEKFDIFTRPFRRRRMVSSPWNLPKNENVLLLLVEAPKTIQKNCIFLKKILICRVLIEPSSHKLRGKFFTFLSLLQSSQAPMCADMQQPPQLKRDPTSAHNAPWRAIPEIQPWTSPWEVSKG